MGHREAFTKIIHPCWMRIDGRCRRSRVFCKVIWGGERLSVTGVIGPRQSGNADGGCGQIAMEFKHANPAHDDDRFRTLIQPFELDFTKGWDTTKWQDFLAIWKIYHLNIDHVPTEVVSVLRELPDTLVTPAWV